MTIFIRTSGGGGIVLLVVLALLYGHGSGLNGTVAIILVVLVVLVVLAILGVLGMLAHRMTQPGGANVPPVPAELMAAGQGGEQFTRGERGLQAPMA